MLQITLCRLAPPAIGRHVLSKDNGNRGKVVLPVAHADTLAGTWLQNDHHSHTHTHTYGRARCDALQIATDFDDVVLVIFSSAVAKPVATDLGLVRFSVARRLFNILTCRHLFGCRP